MAFPSTENEGIDTKTWYIEAGKQRDRRAFEVPEAGCETPE
jgi:hypothetical protein